MNHPREVGTIPASKCACGHFAPPTGEITECRFCDCERHVAGPYRGHDPDTPPGAEAALQTFSDLLKDAQRDLAAACDDEVEAELARDAAARTWLLSDDCPPVGVFNGVRTTVAQQSAWVADRIADKERTYRLAKAAREAAQKYLDVLGRQGSIQQSISKSVGASYQGTGGERW